MTLPFPRTPQARVLVVDDVPEIAQMHALALGFSGYQTAVAHDGPRALDEAARLRPHLVLLDWSMPRGGAAAFLRALRADPRLRDARVILTGSTPFPGSEALESGAAGVLTGAESCDFRRVRALAEEVLGPSPEAC